MNAITIDHISSSYGHTKILDDISVSIPKNKVTMIIGPNGCGKSTLLKNIGRMIKKESGKIYLDGKDMDTMENKEIAKKMAMLPQSVSVPSGLKVKDLVGFGRFPYQKAFAGSSKEDLEIIDWAMRVTGVEEFQDRYVENLSGGQRQRVFIAMALAQKSEIVLLDEPTTYLDIAFQLEILELLQMLNKQQEKTIVMVLHELNLACRFGDHIIGMKDGKILFEGAASEVITKENLKALYGVEANLLVDDNVTYPVCVDYSLMTANTKK